MLDSLRPLPIIAAAAVLWALPGGSSQAAVYAWKDASGAMTYSDNPTQAPPGVQIEVRPYGRFTSSGTVTPRSPAEVTQGEFARQLAIELGLGRAGLSAESAAEMLTRIRIAPPLGRWQIEEPLTKDLLDRLRRLTGAAAAAGRLALDPEEALYAFDTASDLVGMTVSERVASPPPEPAAPERVPAPPAVYIIPVAVPAPVIRERLIFIGGGCCVDGVLSPAPSPVIQIDKRIVKVRKVITRTGPSLPPAPARGLRLRAPAAGVPAH